MNLKSFETKTMIDGIKEEPVVPPAKKQCFGVELNRVAEIVLVLSALGRMRGGETPTELELEMMVEAKSKLAEMCQEFTPKDIIRKDDVIAVIEDLGLNDKLIKDQRLGFQAPKLTISEKFSLGKRKMEEAKKFSTPTVSNGYASHLTQPNGSIASPANRASVAHQWPSNEGTAVNTTGSHLRMERPQMMLNGASQRTPMSSANYYAASWSAEPQSTISFSTAPNKKVPIQSSGTVAEPSYRPFMSQTPHGIFPGTNQPMHYDQTSSFKNSHNVIAKIIHKFLRPLVEQYPLWNLPSREYMSRTVTCEMCQITINEVDTLLICDVCGKAYHLKCLQANSINGVPKSDWHCSRCVQAFSGKPFPPQYGRTVTTTTAKMPSTNAGVQSSSAKKVGSMDIKVNQQKPIVTTSPGVQNFPDFVSEAASTSYFKNASVPANTTTSTAKTADIGVKGFKESVICNTNSPAPVSLTGTTNPTAIASTSAVINNDIMSKPQTPVGTMSSTSPLPVGNQVPVNSTSNATPVTPITASLVAKAPSITETGYSSSPASETADNSLLNTDSTTQVHTLTITSSSNSQSAVSHSENAKATKDAAIGQALNADDALQAPVELVARCEHQSDGPQVSVEIVARCEHQSDEPEAPVEIVARCENPSDRPQAPEIVARSENPSESISHVDSMNDKTTSENGEESSKNATEKSAHETCQTPQRATVLSDQDSKITAKPSMIQENSAYQTEKTASQPPSVSSNHHSQTEEETPNVQDFL